MARGSQTSVSEAFDAGESGRGDADHFKGMAVENQLAAENVRVGSERPLPEMVSDNGYGVSVLDTVVVGGKGAAEGGVDAQQ